MLIYFRFFCTDSANQSEIASSKICEETKTVDVGDSLTHVDSKENRINNVLMKKQINLYILDVLKLRSIKHTNL